MSTRENFKILGMSVTAAVVALVALVGLAVGGVYLASWYSKTTANTRGETQQREANQGNGAFRQATYEQFFDLCQSVQSAEAKVDNLKTQAAQSTDEYEKQRLGLSITAVMNSRADAVTQYNKLAAEKHRQQFLDSNLPYRLDLNNMETTCGA